MKLLIEKKTRQSGMVRVRGGFSESKGISVCNKSMQMNEIDDATRVQLSNRLHNMLEIFMRDYYNLFDYSYRSYDATQTFCRDILNDVFCASNILAKGEAYDWNKLYSNYIENVISNASYNEVFDMVEYVCRWLNARVNAKAKGYSFGLINQVFEQEYVGYRFVDGRIVAITDKNEIDAINEACSVPFEGCRKHFEKAVGFLADRETKDYKNSIKESISAVESVCQVILNSKRAVLSEALKQLERNGRIIHPSLSQAFIKMYAYTSDQGGIRHAEGMFESSVTFEEAKFMLVSCCAFTNYLIAEYGKKNS